MDCCGGGFGSPAAAVSIGSSTSSVFMLCLVKVLNVVGVRFPWTHIPQKNSDCRELFTTCPFEMCLFKHRPFL